MSEAKANEATNPLLTEDPQAETQGNPEDGAEALGDAGKKALDAMKTKWKAAEQERSTLQAKLDEISRANESALEKAQREAAEAREAATKASVDALRFRIAAETGITEHIDLILTATDEETMRRQAELWASRKPASDTTTAGPRPDLTQGGSSSQALNSDGLEDALKAKLGIA